MGDGDVEVWGVKMECGKIKEGDVLVGMKGREVEGEKFIGKGLEVGGKWVLWEEMGEEKVEGVS